MVCRTLVFLLLPLTVLLIPACDRDDEIKVYRLAKPTGESQAMAPPQTDAMASTNAPTPAMGGRAPITSASLGAAAPASWEPQPLSQMRQASFLVHGQNGTGADISLVTLGPAAGNVLDNVNRWLGQLKQAPVTAEKLATMIQKIPTPQGEVAVVDLNGEPESGDPNKDGRIVAAIASDQNQTAFYKLRGNAALVGAEKEGFIKWVTAMQSGGGAPSGAMAGASNSAASAPNEPDLKWEVPPGWSQVPPSAMRYASFAATAPDGSKVDISVVPFPGDGGGDLENINRWRQQIGLPAAEQSSVNATIARLKTSSGDFATTDLKGPNARTLAAWTRRDGKTWFFKMSGPDAAVEKEKDNFGKFVQSVRF